MDIPKNCRECPHSQNCHSYYGGSTCKHQKEINLKTIEEMKNK